MNVHESSNNSNGPNKDLTNFIEQFRPTNATHEVRRTINCSSALLDNALISHPERLATSGKLQVGINDHDLLFVVKKQKLPKPKGRIIEFRSLKNVDQNAFVSDPRNVPWNSSYTFESIDDIWSHWSGLFKQVLALHAPMKRTQLCNNQLPWISPDIQKLIRIRNRLSPCTNRLKLCKYKKQRNTVTAIQRRAIKDFCADIVSTIPSTGLIWKKMKPLLPKNKLNI